MRNMYSQLFQIIVISSFLMALSSCEKESESTPAPACTTLDCLSAKYALLEANIDGSDIRVIRSDTYREMTHPRLSEDGLWVSYTRYNELNGSGCATVTDSEYRETSIQAVRIDGSDDTQIIAPTAGEFASNNFWVGNTYELTYLGGPPGLTKIYRVTANSSMSVISGPTEVSVPGTMIPPFDPTTHSATNKIAYGAQYNNGGLVKSIFMMNLSDGLSITGLTLGRDKAGTTLYGTDVLENDPKFSTAGDKIAFMRLASNSGANGHGWHLFVVDVNNPLSEVNISDSHLGSTILKNDTLPEWIDNDTLIFSHMDVRSATDFDRTLYTMKDDGTLRTEISLPSGYHYNDAFPFKDSNGVQKMVIAIEKIGAACTQ